MKKLHLLLLLLTANLVNAQNRVDRPIQLQANFAGLLLNVAGNAIADATVDDLTVNSWAPGITVGYHLNRSFYLGYSLYAPLDMTLSESWGLTGRALDADIALDHQTGIIHNLEGRFSPFKFGFYLSVGLASVGEVDYQMDFDRKGDEIYVGNNLYPTDLDIRWNSENLLTPTLGFGYTHVSEKGFSFTIGMSVPLSFPDDENIFISSPEDILPSDIALAQQQIQNETFYGPVMLHLNLGYNLTKFWSSGDQ